MAGLQRWKPHNAAHAIQQVTAKIRFTQPVNDIPWRKINSLARAVAQKAGLTTEQPLQDISVAMMPAGIASSVSQSGLEFLRLERPDFYSDKLIVSRGEVTIEEWRYTRWAAFAEKIRAELVPVSDLYAQTVPVLAIMLEYIDIFEAITLGEDADVSEVLKDKNKFVTEAGFSKRQPFHCHTGYFDQHDNITKRLVNVDIDVADVRPDPQQKPLRALRVRTHITDFFNQEGYDEASDEIFSPEFIATRLDEQHIALKKLLTDVLSEDAISSISLKG